MSLNPLLQLFSDKVQGIFFEPTCAFHLFEYQCSRGDHNQTICKYCTKDVFKYSLETRTSVTNINKIHTFSKYINPARQIVHTLKWQTPSLASYLGLAINQLIQSQQINVLADCIIPIPSSINKNRNWSPSLLLAQSLSYYVQIPVIDLLIKEHDTHLVGKSKADRLQSLKNAYGISPTRSLPSYIKHILLLDDLIASGQTMEACAQLIQHQYPHIQIDAIALCSSKE